MGNHVNFAHYVLLPVSEEEKHGFHFFSHYIIKQLLDSVFVISRIIEVSLPTVFHKSCSSTLNSFNLLYLLIHPGIPYRTGIFKVGSH